MATTLDVPTRASLLLAARDPANEKAREAFAAYYAGLIHAWCRRWGLQEADQKDIVQTILCRLLEMLPKFQYDPSKRFRGLLRTMIAHAIADFRRVRQRQPGSCGSGDTGILGQLHEAPAPDDPTVEDLAQELASHVEWDQQLREACYRVQQRVNLYTWQAFWLTTYEGRLAAEVAQQLGMKKETVLVYKHRVIKMIRSEIEGAAG